MAQPPAWGAPPPPPPPPPPGSPVPPGWGAVPLPFRRLHGLAIALYVLLAVAALCAAIAVPLALEQRRVVHEHTTLDVFRVTSAVKDATDAAAGIVGFFGLVFLATAVVFMIWMWRAAANLLVLRRHRPRFATGFAVGGWFIPLANLLIPGMHMHDIWKGSGPPPVYGERPQGSPLVIVWWVTFVFGELGVFLNPTSLEVGSSYRVSGFDVMNLLFVIGAIFSVVSAVLAILVVPRSPRVRRTRRGRWA